MAKMEEILRAIREASDEDKRAFVTELENSGYSVKQTFRSDTQDQKELEYLKKRAQLQGEVADATRLAYEEEKARMKMLADSLVAEEKKAGVLAEIDNLYNNLSSKEGRAQAGLADFEIPELNDSLAKIVKMSETQEDINQASKEFARSAGKAAKGVAGMVGGARKRFIARSRACDSI